MAEVKNADRTAFEIRSLLRKLHPNNGKHNDRVRALTKFRNYVMGGNKSPEFYDDDIPLLLLGSSAPAAYLDPDDDTLAGLYGLLQACGTTSSHAEGGGGGGSALKRSARPAMVLVKELVLDWKESSSSKKDDLNVICQSFLELPVHYYSTSMQLDAHCSSGDHHNTNRQDTRGGAKQEACELIVLILTKHLSEDGQSAAPVTLEEILLQPKAQQEFELWSARHISATVKEVIKKNTAAREAELATLQRQDALANKADEFLDLEDATENEDDTERGGGGDDDDHGGGGVADDDDAAYDKDDVVATMRKRRKDLKMAMKTAVQTGELEARGSAGVATRWEDSLVAREQKARAAAAARGNAAMAAAAHDTVRDSQEAAKEEAERNEGKAKVMGKDPLEIVTADDFDLRHVEKSQAEYMEQALHEVQTEMQKAEAMNATDELRAKVTAQKESLEALIDRMGGIEAMENIENLKYSVLPTSPKFDPILFLTLVHRSDNYDTLVGSLDRLSSKTENQVEQLENLVRDNFPLFVRCAEGFDEFQNSETDVGMGVNERIDKLEGIAESCAYQAKKSFSPLLDNTREVRKVQSAMAVLQRVAPILQAPAMMRQHLENRRYSEALKTYRRVLVVDEACKIELLLRVKANAQECVREARRDLERRLSRDKVSVDDLLDGIRDLGELLELDVPALAKKKSYDSNESPEDEGIYDIGGTVVKTRDHPPALACLLLQAAHFSYGVKTMILEADETCQRIFSGEPLSQVQSDVGMNRDAMGDGGASVISSAVEMSDDRATVGAGNQWKYDILDARVVSTIQAVNMARAWLGRLVRVGLAAREDEKRRAARIGSSRRKLMNPTGSPISPDNNLTAFEVFISNVTPSLHKLIEHAAFCALGSNTARRDGKDIVMTFGQTVTEKLRAILKSPLPPTQSTKVGKALADLAAILTQNMDGANSLRPELNNEMSMFHLSPLEACKTLSDSAVVTIEKRRCIYAFDVCARAGANRASGSGKFDADALLHCLQNLADDLACPEACAAEVEKGCELVVRRCCEGLASYVRDRGDSARLSAVAECADVVADRIAEIVDEVSALLNADTNRLEEIMLEDIVGLESAMFDEYLENIRQGVAGTVRIGWLDVEQEQQELETHATSSSSFPAYLSASLLAIVRCRAQVEQALGDKIRGSENVSYEHLALATVSEGVVEGICNEVMVRKPKLKVRQADKLANELEFLRNTLKRFLRPDTLSIMESTLNMVNSKAGRGRDFKGDGPDGLAALEELERLGRVYVLCLGD